MKLTMISQGPRQPLILVLMLVLTAPGAAAENVLRLQARDGGRDGRVVLIANLDDDDRDGLPDAADNVINGVTDLLDTTPLVIEADDPAVTAVRLTRTTRRPPPGSRSPVGRCRWSQAAGR
jgi:hypothetical protein